MIQTGVKCLYRNPGGRGTKRHVYLTKLDISSKTIYRNVIKVFLKPQSERQSATICEYFYHHPKFKTLQVRKIKTFLKVMRKYFDQHFHFSYFFLEGKQFINYPKLNQRKFSRVNIRIDLDMTIVSIQESFQYVILCLNQGLARLSKKVDHCTGIMCQNYINPSTSPIQHSK